MLSKDDYLKDPCASLSIPYWKYINYHQPQDIRIEHQDQLESKAIDEHTQRYFRMIHHLDNLPLEDVSVEVIQLDKDIKELVEMLKRSYKHEDIKVSKDDIISWTRRRVYDPNLWVKIVKNNRIVASGISEIDLDLKEGIIEWVQVVPEERNRGYGRLIVEALLNRLSLVADFVTVSGHLDNQTKPRELYRRCGFVGEDIWYVRKHK